MRQQSIKRNFKRKSDANLIVSAQTVIDSLTDNDNFPTPQPTVAALTTALEDFQTSVAVAKTGGAEQKSIRDAKKIVLVDLLREEATYIELASAGDVTKMLSSGFELTKIPETIGALGKPQNFQVIPEGAGMLKLSLDGIKGAKSYQFEIKKATDAEWTVLPSSKTKLIVTDLQRGTEYIARVVPIGASDIREYSDEISAWAA
jgi:hypothetical protein